MKNNADLITDSQQKDGYRIKVGYKTSSATVTSVTIWQSGLLLSKMKELIRHIIMEYQPQKILLINEKKEK